MWAAADASAQLLRWLPKGMSEVAGLGREVWGDCDGQNGDGHCSWPGQGGVWGPNRLKNVLGGNSWQRYSPLVHFAAMKPVELRCHDKERNEVKIYFLWRTNLLPSPGGKAKANFRVKDLRPETGIAQTGEYRLRGRLSGISALAQFRFNPRLDGSGSTFVVAFASRKKSCDPVDSLSFSLPPPRVLCFCFWFLLTIWFDPWTRWLYS